MKNRRPPERRERAQRLQQRIQSPESGCVWRSGAWQRGMRIEKVLAERFPFWSQDHIFKLMRQERILVAGQAVACGFQIAGAERIEILPRPARAAVYLPNRSIKIRVIHADSCIAVVDKPPGVPVHPGPGHGSDTMVNGMLALYREELEELGAERRWGMVHRLDQDTSGVMIFARSAGAYETLTRAFEKRLIKKSYLALLSGDPGEARATVEEPVDGKSATSHFTIVERFGNCALAHVAPVSGRRHQIRLHAAHLGHPVVGDERHGPARPPEHPLRRLGLARMFLHAESITLPHPATLQDVTFSAALPRDLRRALNKLRRVP